MAQSIQKIADTFHCCPVKISTQKLVEKFELFGRIPVRGLRNGFAVQCEDFEQGKTLHKRIADSIRQFRETELESMQEFDVCDQKIMDKRDIDLRHDGVFTGSKEAPDFEILLDPFEKDFDLPALFVNSGNARRRQLEVIGNEVIFFSGRFIQKFNQP